MRVLNARSIINKKTELNIMVDDIKPHIIGITESWANNDITNAELGLEGYVTFRKDRIGRRGGGVLLYIKDTIPAYEVQLQEEADCNEAIWCNDFGGKILTGSLDKLSAQFRNISRLRRRDKYYFWHLYNS